MFETKTQEPATSKNTDAYEPTTANLLAHLEHAANSSFERGVVAVLRSMANVSPEDSQLSEYESDEQREERARAARTAPKAAPVAKGTF